MKYECHASINVNTKAYRECSGLKECEKFYLELGYPFYANDEIKHYGNDTEGHRYYLDVDDQKAMLDYVRAMAKKCDFEDNLATKTDEEIILFALSYLGANIEDAKQSGLGE